MCRSMRRCVRRCLRTRQTGEAILGNRDVKLKVVEALGEIRPITGQAAGGYDIVSDVAFSHWRAHQADATFLGGERYHDFYARVSAAMDAILADQSWHNLAVFAHGGTNAAVLGWATGVGLAAFGLLDQSTCCLNVIDFDVDESGQLLRKTVRGMNITAYDPVMHRRMPATWNCWRNGYSIAPSEGFPPVARADPRVLVLDRLPALSDFFKKVRRWSAIAPAVPESRCIPNCPCARKSNFENPHLRVRCREPHTRCDR